MSHSVQSLIAYVLDAEFKVFLKTLNKCPREQFDEQPSLGHSVAWHALHMMDWTRCIIQPELRGLNRALTYSYLGFENLAWAQAVTGPTLAYEQDGKDAVVASVEKVFRDAVEAVQSAPTERFTENAMFAALEKPRPVLESLTYHVRHTAYHRGQLVLTLKGLA